MKEETTYGHQELINQVIDYIHTHLHKALTLEMLAAEMHMSVYHFHRLFKSHLQETLSAYITRQRMERAVICKREIYPCRNSPKRWDMTRHNLSQKHSNDILAFLRWLSAIH